MRKTLLLATALCLASAAMAQTSPATVKEGGISALAESTATGATVDDPIELVEGTNTVPAAAGKYYFILHPSKTGYLKITSEDALTGGQVWVYGTYYHAKNDKTDFAKGNSTIGSYNVRMEVPYATAYTSYYIVVDKKTTTDNTDTFTLQIEDYQPGQTEATAIKLDDSSKSLTLPETNATYYYAIDIAANTNKYIVVNGPETLNSKSSVTLYPRGESGWNDPTMQNGKLKSDVINETDKTYILKVVSAEGTPMTLNVSYEDIQKGSLIKLPKGAVSGQNTIDLDAEAEYFIYTATMDGKLTVEVNDNSSVSFPKGTGKWDGEYEAIINGNTYSIEATKEKKYLITVTGLKKNETFTITESAFQPGESMETAINIEGNSYTFGDNTSNLWLKYNVTADGVLEISCDAQYNGTGSINVSKNGLEAEEILEQGSYKGKVFANTDDVLYINVIMEESINGKILTITSRDFLPGEDYTKPIVLEKGESTDVSAGTWVKCSLPKGESTLSFINYATFNLYKSLNDVKMEEITFTPTTEEELGDGTFISKFKVTMEEADDIYIKVTHQEGGAKLVYAEVTDGISNVEAGQQDGTVTIYDLNGRKLNEISGNGVYIIKGNGQTKKVVIKK